MDLSRWKRNGFRILAITAVSVSSLALVACGGDDDDDTPTVAATTAAATTAAASATTAAPAATTATKAAGIDYTKLSGEVKSDGSSTVFPISEAVAEEFSKVAKNVKANVALSDTGGGFEKFCRKEIQVSDASRPINQKEKDACASAGITDVVELSVAINALTVVVYPATTSAKSDSVMVLQVRAYTRTRGACVATAQRAPRRPVAG